MVGYDNEVIKYCIDAKEFRDKIGGIKREKSPEGELIIVKPANQQAFEQAIDTLLVIGRADPYDKQVIAAGLQLMGRKVAVIGEGLNDITAFESADVSFAMGSGKSIARNKASMVLLDNDFDSCVKAVLRGRNIYSNIKRFLQFQVTVNFSILVSIFIGCIYLT